MAVQNIECQIARNQIGRYLTGDPFSPEALKQLEAHVAECDDCKESLNQRKAALQAMLGATPSAVVEVPETPAAKTTFAESLRGKFSTKPRPEPKETPVIQPSAFWKPLTYSVALAIVLVGMSLYSKTLSQPFGKTVIDTSAESPEASADAKPTSTAPPATVEAKPVSTSPASAAAPPANTKGLPDSPETALATGQPPAPASQQKAPETATAKSAVSTPAPAFALPNGKVQKAQIKDTAPQKIDDDGSTDGENAAAVPAPHKVAHAIRRSHRVVKARAKTAKRIRKHSSHAGAIRVYGPDGNLISSK